jgi:hypothetical protein
MDPAPLTLSSGQAHRADADRAIAAASEIIGDDGRAATWFHHCPLAGFDGQTAEKLVAAGHIDAVLMHLDTLADGGFA